MEAVIGVIFNAQRDKVLLVQRKDVAVWVLPGGGVDAGETREAAVIREILEETHLTVRVKKTVAIYQPINRLAQPTTLFECDVISGDPAPSEETRAVAFFSIHSLPKSFFFIHREWLKDALENNPDVIKKELTSVTYWGLLGYLCKHPWQVLRFMMTRIRGLFL